MITFIVELICSITCMTFKSIYKGGIDILTLLVNKQGLDIMNFETFLVEEVVLKVF